MLVRQGEKHEHKGITFFVIEVQAQFSASRRKRYMISWRLSDPRPPHSEKEPYVTPIAHLWLPVGMDIRQKIAEVVDHYVDIMDRMKGVPLP